MKILIVGGGVGGPALARFMKDHAEVTLVDKAPAWGNIGYAITLWGNGQKILKDLGLDSKVLKGSYEMPWSVFEDHSGHILKSFTYDIFRAYGPTVVVTRADLQKSLTDDLEKYVKIKLGTTVSSIENTTQVAQVTFSDGTTDTFDLVVGADGIHSQVRELVFGDGFTKYYGWKVYAFWSPQKLAVPRGSIEFSSGGKICFIYPMQDKAVVMLAVASKDTIFNKDANYKGLLHDIFKDFKDLVKDLIDNIEDPAHVFHDNLAYIEMKDWYRNRVVLMGDAKHAISPITGMGASMALEDAFVLADELKKISVENIFLALENYKKRREKRINKFHRVSDLIEFIMMVKSPVTAFFRDLFLRVMPISFFTNKIKNILTEKI